MLDRRRRKAATVGAAAFAILALGVASTAKPVPLLVYNASASAPIGFYRRAGGPIDRGDFVLARLPEPVAHFAAERGYLPMSVPVVKRVAALPGDIACAETGSIKINGDPVADALPMDRQGRPLSPWNECRPLVTGEVFLLMAGVRASFDGRYFGPIGRAAILGRLVPLWTW